MWFGYNIFAVTILGLLIRRGCASESYNTGVHATNDNDEAISTPIHEQEIYTPAQSIEPDFPSDIEEYRTPLKDSQCSYVDANSIKGFININLDSIFDIDLKEYYLHHEDNLKNKEKSDDLVCIETYVKKTNEIYYNMSDTKDEAYLYICKMCKHIYKDIEECREKNMQLMIRNMKITVPQIRLKYEKDNRNNQEIIINTPVTYVLSNLLSSLIKTVTYNTDDLNNSCKVLINMLHLDLLKIMDSLQYYHGIFNGLTEKHLIEFRKIFLKKQKINKEEDNDNDNIWEECFILKKSIDKVMNINSYLLMKSRNRYMDYVHNRRKRYRHNLFVITYNVSDKNLNTYIKSIYNYIYNSIKIIEYIQYIYNQEVYAIFFVRTQLIETYFLRNPKQLKNTCSIYMMITISWFFNQINIGMYNKNKKIYDLFKEKFTKNNIKQIIYSIYTNDVENKTNILQLCNDSMTNTVELIKNVIKNYYKQNNVLSNYNINYAGLIKFMDIYILRHKFIQSTLEQQPLTYYDTLDDEDLNHDSIIKRENIVCMMKYISNKINTYISLLKKSHLQTIMLQNYDNYNIYINEYFTDNEHIFFCTSPGQYLISKIFYFSFFNIINIYG
ncbi:conserved Plasmodium protein, unknown function [Plasmodium gaboni]|uniref:Uncharacterized protein n=1 Tax=Plasmodium gaboni TaxID=647221 RepID=A0ABY1UJU1_9APIC|nr:conserved Plasmodium protein, unknown function [Plasmodium gaboni]